MNQHRQTILIIGGGIGGLALALALLIALTPDCADGKVQGVFSHTVDITELKRAEATVKALAKGRRQVWIPRALGAAVVVMRMLPRFVWRRMPR